MKYFHLREHRGHRGHYADRNNSEGEKQIPYDLIYMCNLKKESHRHRTNWWLPDGSEVGELGEKSEEIRKYKLAVTK